MKIPEALCEIKLYPKQAVQYSILGLKDDKKEVFKIFKSKKGIQLLLKVIVGQPVKDGIFVKLYASKVIKYLVFSLHI